MRRARLGYESFSPGGVAVGATRLEGYQEVEYDPLFPKQVTGASLRLYARHGWRVNVVTSRHHNHKDYRRGGRAVDPWAWA
jgi:hypothetical protein